MSTGSPTHRYGGRLLTNESLRAASGGTVVETFRKIFHLVGRDKPGRWVAVILGAAVATGFEMLGALLVFLLLALITDRESELDVPLLGNLRERFTGVDETTFLLTVAAVLGAFFLARVIVQIGLAYIKHRMAHNAAARISSRLAEGYLRLPYAFHLRRSSAELVRNAHQTLEMLAGQSFLPTIHVLAEALIVLGLLALMLGIAPVGTALAIVVVGGAALLLLKVVQPRLRRLGAEAQEMRKQTLGTLQQSLHGIRDVKVLGVEKYFGDRYHADRRRLARSLYFRGVVSEMPRLVIETALVGFILLLFGFSVITEVGNDELLSKLGLFAYVGLRVMPSLQKVVTGLNNIRFSAPAVEQVYEDLLLVERVEGLERDIEPLGFQQAIRLAGVGYVYDETDHPAVADVDLEIRRGEVVGICGPTGGGKTTLTDLITGILPPTDGEVTVDGVDIHTRLPRWYEKLGVVPQMVFLIDDTLRRNIALGVPDDAIDELAVREAVRLAQLDEFVASLPAGLETQVGERGVRVSGGQRQRVAIARALYRHPEVLIFDEGTSALDSVTESILIGSIERLRGEHTILLVAHRLSTVRDCDKIVYLEGGRVQGVGTFEQLRAESAGFRALSQNG